MIAGADIPPSPDRRLIGWNPATLRLVLGIFAASSAFGVASANLSPILIDGLNRGRGMSLTAAGLVQSLELMAAAITGLILASRAARYAPRRLALVGGLTAMIAHLGSNYAPDIYVLSALRISAGVGAGLCACAGNVALSRTGSAARVYAMCSIVAGLAFGALFPVIAQVNDTTHGTQVYLVQAIWSALAAPLLMLLPSRMDYADSGQAAIEPLPWRMLLLAAPVFIFMFICTGAYVFESTVATSIGVKASDFGYSMTVAQIIALVSAAVVSVAASRFGLMAPLGIGIILCTTAKMIFFQTHDPMVALVSNVAIQASFAFVAPFLFGLCGRLDPPGRLMTVVTSAALLGASIAPFVAGAVFQRYGYYTVSWSFPAFGVSVFAMIWLIGRQRPQQVLIAPA